MKKGVLAIILFIGICALILTAAVSAGLFDKKPSGTNEGSHILFVLEKEYKAGQTVDVKIINRGSSIYLYRESFAACDLSYYDESGRKFIIPPGTHCDLLNMKEIRPGQTVTLFKWQLDECTRDEFGCQEKRALPPGRYIIKGSFKTNNEEVSNAEQSFKIVE